jgi:hypothetical protein
MIKDIVLFAGVLVTLILGIANLIYNLKTSKRSAFVNTVTAERIKWISKMRDNISHLCALCDQLVCQPPQDRAEFLRQIEQLKNEISLQLNLNHREDQDVESHLKKLPNFSNSMSPDDYWKLQATLISSTQALLKREWDKVKDESTKGDLRSKVIGDRPWSLTFPRCLTNWINLKLIGLK